MWESRVLRRAFERLELHEGKLSRAVLRGGGGGNVTSLPDTWVGNHPSLPGPRTPNRSDPEDPREGYHTPRSRKGYTSTSVRKLLSRCELTHGRIGTRQLDRHEWWLPDLARALQMPVDKLRIWAIRGWVRSRQVPPRGLWVVWADGRERRRLWKLMADSRSSKSAEQTSS